MADIQVRIKLNAGVDGDQINSVAFNQETNNVSKAVGLKTTKNDGQNLISWGEDGLISLADGYVGGANATLSSQGGYNGFVFGVVPENKMYSVEVMLEGKNIDSVTFYGDRNANQFPTRAIVNGEYIYSDDAEWTIVFPSRSATQTITFDMWNRANYNACFTHIGVFVNELVLDKRRINSVESLSQATGQPQEVYYGVTYSNGSVEIRDVNGEILDYIKDGILNYNNVEFDLYIGDKVVAKHLSTDSSYNLDSKSFSVELTSIFDRETTNLGLNEVVENKNIEDFTSQNGLSLEEILKKYVFDDKDIEYMLSNKIYISNNNMEMNIVEYLKSIKTKYFYIFNKTKKDILNEICKVAQLSFIDDEQDGWKFISARKQISNDIYPIFIPKRNIFSTFYEDVILKNKYDSVRINQPEIIHTKDYIYSKDFTIKEDGVYDGYTTKYMGLDATITNSNMPWIDVQPYIDFSDNVKQSPELMFILDDATYEIIRTSDTAYANSSGNLDYSLKKKTYSHSLYLHPIKNTNSVSGYFCYLKNPDTANEDGVNNFHFSINLYPWTYNNEAGVLYYPSTIQAKILAQKYVQNKKDIYYGNGANEVSLESDLLLHSNTWIQLSDGEIDMPTIVAQNILEDYKDGIRTATVSISCNNYYNTNGDLVKDWDNQEIIKVGDIVKVEMSDKWWRVTGRKFRKVGVPMIDLELQEVIPVYADFMSEYWGETTWILEQGNDKVYKKIHLNSDSKKIEHLDEIEDFSNIKIGDRIFYKIDDKTSLKLDILGINSSDSRYYFDANISRIYATS